MNRFYLSMINIQQAYKRMSESIVLNFNYLRVGLQRRQSNGPPHVAIGLIQLSLLVLGLDKIQSEMQSSQ